MNLEDHYTRLAGQLHLFSKAPPMAEVVLEVIGEKRYIFAESFKGGARWWHWNGVRARRGLPEKNLSDYYCAATRQPKLAALEAISKQQQEWDQTFGIAAYLTMETQAPCAQCGITGIHACIGSPVREMTPEQTEELARRLKEVTSEIRRSETPTAMRPTRTCMTCGELVADGMIHSCNPRWDFTQLPPLVNSCPDCGIVGAHYCTRNPKTSFREFLREHTDQTDKPERMEGEFVSIFAADRFGPRPWIRVNRSGRIKVCQRLMERFDGMLIDVMLNTSTGRIRLGECEQGKPLNERGHLHCRPITKLIDFGGEPNVFIYLDEHDDGWMYGSVPLKDADGAAPLER